MAEQSHHIDNQTFNLGTFWIETKNVQAQNLLAIHTVVTAKVTVIFILLHKLRKERGLCNPKRNI